MRDPKRINLRYETPWFNELLLANLLAPVGGGPLSQFVSEQEYSKLFEANRFGISSTSNYFSSDKILETASQYGIYNNVSYSLDTEFQYDNGRRPNNEITRSESYASAKVQITLQDSVFFQTKYEDLRTGDLLQYYSQDQAQPGVHFRELQQPAIILAGYHRQWTPGVDTLLLVGRLSDETFFNNLNQDPNSTDPNISRSLIFVRDPSGNVVDLAQLPMDLHYHNRFTTFTGELNQIWEQPNNTLIAGARFQSGEFHTSDRFDNLPASQAFAFNDPAAAHDFVTDLERETVYAYDIWRPFRSLSITAALSYDHLEYPIAHRSPPIVDAENSRSRLSPKAGVIWNPFGKFIVRAAYSQALGGVSFDESVQLEPTSVAGFNQVFRSIISESVQGAVSGPTYESGGVMIEDKFASGTYLGIQATLLKSDVDRRVGVFDENLDAFGQPILPIVPSSTPQSLRYEEQNLLLTVNQLLGDEWSFGARYQVTFSNLETIFAELASDARQKATLHQATLFALYNHPSGFFARLEAYWARQSNIGYAPDIPGDEIFQFNAYAGYRLRRNFGDLTLGFLNMTDQDYKLNPLNYYNELPRERTLLVRLRLNF